MLRIPTKFLFQVQSKIGPDTVGGCNITLNPNFITIQNVMRFDFTALFIKRVVNIWGVSYDAFMAKLVNLFYSFQRYGRN